MKMLEEKNIMYNISLKSETGCSILLKLDGVGPVDNKPPTD